MKNTKLFKAFCAFASFVVGMTGGSMLQQHFDKKEAIVDGVGHHTTYQQTRERVFLYSPPSSETLQGFTNSYEKNN